MIRKLLACSSVLVFLVFVPSVAEASIIQCGSPPDASCSLIAEFSWSRDAFFGDVFAVKNATGGSLADDFSSLGLALEGSVITNTGFFDDPLASQATTEAVDLLDGVTGATLTFTYRGVVFSAQLGSNSLVGDDSNSFTSTTLFAQAVPEPGTLLMVGAGILAGLIRRRHSARIR